MESEAADSEPNPPQSLPPDRESGEQGFTRDQQRRLLQLAREAIATHLQRGRLPDVHIGEPALCQMAGVFVTLRQRRRHLSGDGRLRGCVGRFEAELPIHQGVREMAVKAAVSDPRFSPLTLDELPDVRIEISVLTLPRQVRNIEEIEIGRDGLMIHHHGRRGVLLPKVAVSRQWNRKQFLQQLCRKAGLPDDSWTAGARLYAFSATSLVEDE